MYYFWNNVRIRADKIISPNWLISRVDYCYFDYLFINSAEMPFSYPFVSNIGISTKQLCFLDMIFIIYFCIYLSISYQYTGLASISVLCSSSFSLSDCLHCSYYRNLIQNTSLTTFFGGKIKRRKC